MRLHCTAAWSRPCGRALFAHCGPLGALGRRLPGAGAYRSARGRSSRPPGGPRLRLVAFVSSPPAWRAPCRAPASAPRPPPVLGSVVGSPAPGLWAPGGAGGAPPCGALRRRRASAPSVCFPRPPCRLAAPGGGYRRRISDRGDVAFSPFQDTAVRPGRDGA